MKSESESVIYYAYTLKSLLIGSVLCFNWKDVCGEGARGGGYYVMCLCTDRISLGIHVTFWHFGVHLGLFCCEI